MCQLVGISRSAYYAWLVRLNRPPSKHYLKDQAILRAMIGLHNKYPVLGLDSLYQMLKRDFTASGQTPPSRNRIHRLKKQAKIYSRRHKAYKVTTNSKHNNPIAPNLLGKDADGKRFKATYANQAWTSDITYIPTGEGWLYCVIIKDLFTKKVVGYATSNRINTQLVIDALNMAIFRQSQIYGAYCLKGLIFHSDRGVQYTATTFVILLEAHGFVQSMSRKGNPYDNAVAENFFSCLKCECVHLNHFATRNAAKLAIFSYIETFYNRVRPHSGIGWVAPMTFERMLTDDVLGVKMVA